MNLIKQHFSKKPEKTIYHYTSQEGLIGILKNEEIWASKLQYLNDSTEFSYAFNLLRDRLKNQYPNLNNTITERILNSIDGSENLNVFAASFSEEEDLLSQWRAYCPDMGGYNIGFNYEDIETSLNDLGFNIIPCEYDKKKQNSLLDELINKTLERFNKTGSTGWERKNGDLREAFIRLASTLKHPSFEEEKEWRVVSDVVMFTNQQVAFRPGTSMLIPYYKLKIFDSEERFNFRNIYVGPTPHKDLAKRSILGFILKHNHFDYDRDQPRILKSEIPYRTW